MSKKFVLKPSQIFLQQAKELNKQAAEITKKKLLLLKENPYRNKRIYAKNLFLFRIRLKDQQKEKRIIYLIEGETVKIICILDRKNNYKDLKKYLEKLGYK